MLFLLLQVPAPGGPILASPHRISSVISFATSARQPRQSACQCELRTLSSSRAPDLESLKDQLLELATPGVEVSPRCDQFVSLNYLMLALGNTPREISFSSSAILVSISCVLWTASACSMTI